MSNSRLMVYPALRKTAATALFLLLGSSVQAATLAVGQGKTFSTPCQAFSSARDGDTVEIDAAGTYSGDVCGIYPSNLTIRGVNGRPKVDAAGRNSMGKGTWVVEGNNTTIENVEMFGASVADQNGAAVRLDGMHLTLRRVYFHHNENGVLTNNDGVSNIVVENSEFAFNGYGSGYTHNLYIGHVNSLIFRGNYSHDANVGHNLKSRAQTNTVTYNRFSSTGGGQPSYEVDFPNGGTTYFIGNIVQQPAANQNPNMLGYGEEGNSNNGHDLYVVNNTFINDDSSRGNFLLIGDSVGTPVLMQNNMFVGTGSVTNQSNAIDRTNYRTLSPMFVDRASFDLHPAAGSPVINAGSAVPGAASGILLTATSQYKATATTEDRPISGTIDIGAYEAGSSATKTSPASDTTAPVAPTTPLTTVVAPTVSWTPCASENGTCSFSGSRQVRYGANGQYAFKSATASIACDNATFGDPAYGTAKVCDFASTSSTTTTPATPPPAPATPAPVTPAPAPSITAAMWSPCGTEGSYCSFSGTMQVRYGANGKYAYQIATGSVACNNDTFGDPAYGVTKTCEFTPLSSPVPAKNPTPAIPETVATLPAITVTPAVTWASCATENGTCSFTGTHQIRYGIPGQYAYKFATGAIRCDNGTFGDPAYGIVKSCEYAM